MARIFAAIMLPIEVQVHLDEYLDGVRTARSDLRWSPPAKWHCTLQYLGECGPHEVDRQLGRWELRAKRGRPMQLNLAGAGTFPHAAIARTLWAGLDGELDAWRRVAGPDQQAHVTLARTRERIDLTGLVDDLEGYVGPTWTAEELAVVESHLQGSGERGRRYEPLEFFPLGG